MRKLSLLLLICTLASAISANAQINRSQARETEWTNYALPQTNFVRQTDEKKNIVFRVPADWKQEESQLVFNGPHAAQLTVTIQDVPDGYPLLQYFSSLLQAVQDQSGLTEATVTRKTHFQDLEAREIFLEVHNPEGEMVRATSWVTINGPLAVIFNLKVPVAHAADVEPYFKAVVQSVIFLPPQIEDRRSLIDALAGNVAGPIHEIQSLVASLNRVEADRESIITRLTTLFSSHASVTTDLLLDRRPLVRTAATEALARTNNNTLRPILWTLVKDPEPLVAEAAARVVVNEPDVVAKIIDNSAAGHALPVIASIWPFLATEKRIELLQRTFSKTAVSPESPPPPIKAPPSVSPRAKVTVTGPTELKLLGEPLIALTPGVFASHPNVQIGALTLLKSLPPEEFKVPFARVLSANYNPLTAVALQVASERGESLPLDALLKLVASSNQQVSKLAARNLPFSATVADIPRIESLIPKKIEGTANELETELKNSISKIRLRHELNAATSAGQKRELVRKALSDSALANFAWLHDCEMTVAGCDATTTLNLDREFKVAPFAENLLPKKVKHYTAIPNPAQLVQRFHESLNGVQLDSARAQSVMLLTMGVLRDELASVLSAPHDASSLIEYTGLDPVSPIVFAAWTADGALDSTPGAERQAVVLRVKDRWRFERMLRGVHPEIGDLSNLTEGIALGTRFFAALPAILPLSAQMAASDDFEKSLLVRPRLTYRLTREEQWQGLRIKAIDRIWIKDDGELDRSTLYMTFLNGTVVLTRDLASLRELLSKHGKQGERQYLADNEVFRKAVESRGDVVYFSDVAAVSADASTAVNQSAFKASERGAVTIGASTWENAHHFEFEDSDWAKSLQQFHPRDLSSPRELLPASSIAYVFMRLDPAAFWSSQAKEMLTAAHVEAIANAWALDFHREVLPELGPECGGVMLESFDPIKLSGGSLAVFCKLKSDKLAEALKTGKLFRGVGPVADFAELKISDLPFFVGVRGGFLVAANTSKGLALLDGKSNLAATRDYSRAVEKVPNGIVAFGGYNLEAAIAAARQTPVEGPEAEGVNVITSVASAFHSQNFYATATGGTVSGRSSVAMDREGRYRVSDITYLPRGTNIDFVTLEPRGVAITDQKRLGSMVLKLRAKSPGPIDNIKDDIKTPDQSFEQKTPNELLLTVAARRGGGTEKQIELPIKNPELEPYLKATKEFPADNKEIKDQALKIVGEERDAWTVAQKLGEWTHQNLEWKSVTTASAAETLATREADCSEFSQLFVSMARSLGLPARMVSGLAYTGNSFGGHAWVEVWAGRWIELDPTWGTDYVDATHIRNNTNALLMSAALNLIEIEVIETKRTVPDFQKSAKDLTKHLINAITRGDRSDIEAVLDPAVLTDEYMGAGSWSKMTDGEREQMSSAQRRLINEIIQGYGRSYNFRLLYIDESPDEATATCLLSAADIMLKLRLVRRHDLWYLVEAKQADTGLSIAAETLQPMIAAIEKARAGGKPVSAGLSDFVRVLLLMHSNSAKTLAVADAALQARPGDKDLMFLHAITRLRTTGREDEGLSLLRKLGEQGYSPAVLRLAEELARSEDEEQLEAHRKEQLAALERYTSLEPRDPRGFRRLAVIYANAEDIVKAEAAYRKSIELEPAHLSTHLDLINLLTLNDRIDDARSVLVAGEKQVEDEPDFFGRAVANLYYDDSPAALKFALSEPSRLKTSYRSNVILARIYLEDKRYVDALRQAEISAELNRESSEPYVVMAEAFRKQRRWTSAIKMARRALEIDEEDGEAHFEMACALTRLGRTKQALESLKKAWESGYYESDEILSEPDLKALQKLPAFKKLLSAPEN